MPESKPGSFSAYLEYAQRGSSAAPTQAPNAASLLNLLNQLPNHTAAMSSMAELSQMSASAFRDALKKLSESGFIKISGEPLSEIVELTTKGQDAITLLS